MQITPINSSQNFQGLNTKKLCSMDLKLIKNELPLLEELGKKYDIKLRSSFEGLDDIEFIDITVSPLKKNFWTKLFGQKEKTKFYLNKQEKSILEKVKTAINELNAKNKLGQLIDNFA